MRKAFDFLSTLATLAVLTYVAFSTYQTRREHKALTTAASESFAKRRIDGVAIAHALPVLDERNLVIAVSPDCHFCRQSAPFFRSVVSVGKGRAKLRVYFLFPVNTNDEVARLFLANLKTPGGAIVKADFEKLGIAGTPTVTLIDQGAHVVGHWVGLLDTKQQGEVLARL
jgi:hypothetical protein